VSQRDHEQVDVRVTQAAAVRRRFPRWVFGSGNEPDPRFTLANERTFLAWMRTALALTAGGIALEAFSVNLEPRMRLIASFVLLVSGLVLPLGAWVAWMRTERALRAKAPLQPPLLGLPLAIVVSATATVVMLGVLNR